MKKAIKLGCLTFIIGLTLIIGLVALLKEGGSSETIDEDLTPLEQITQNINNELGKKTNEDKIRVVKVETGEFTKITINGDQTFSNKDAKKRFLTDAAEIFPIIFKDNDVKKVMITVKTTFVDEYGKESDDDAIRVMLTRENYEKIVWKNFNVMDFGNIADSLYTHPAVNKASLE